MMGNKQKLKAGEDDLIFEKNFLTYLGRAGVARKLKRKMNKRRRKEVKYELRELIEE